MTDSPRRRFGRPKTVTLVSAGLVLAGLLLTAVDWGFLALVALGGFGPGILREFGWLRDQDEFQRRAVRRAGYHAYLVTGFLALLLVAALRSRGEAIEMPGELVTLLLAVLWFTWLLSSLISYWGARVAAFRILMVFGAIWLVFNVLGNLGSPVGLLMQSLLAAPFFLMAWASRRWPRATGVLLLAVSAFFFHFFGLYEAFTCKLSMQGIVLVLFLGPLMAGGVALLRVGGDKEAPREE